MKTLIAIVRGLTIPIGLLNLFGGIVSGLWLAILGEWQAIGFGLASLLGSHLAISLALMPSWLFVVPGMYSAERGNKFSSYFFVFLNLLYTIALLTAWCIGVFYFFLSMAQKKSLIPMMLWSYGVATGPWAFLASRDQQAGIELLSLSTFFAELGYATILLMVFLMESTMRLLITTFAAIMGVGMILLWIIGVSAERRMGTWEKIVISNSLAPAR